jgi:hypothetical protein
MRWRPGHLALLVFQTLWLNVVLPGHTRGVVTLAGAACDSCTSRESHVAGSAVKHHCSASRRQPSSEPTQKQKANCAICAFAARITPPPPILTAPAHAGSSLSLDVPGPGVVVSPRLIPTYYGNGPPPLFCAA